MFILQNYADYSCILNAHNWWKGLIWTWGCTSSNRIAKRWKSRSTIFACWNSNDMHHIKSIVYQIGPEKYITNIEMCAFEIIWTWIIYIESLVLTKPVYHIHHLLQYIIINSIWDRLYSQHKFNSLHFNLMWFSFLNVTFHDLSLPRNNEVHFNSILKMKFHSRSPNCGNPSVNLSFLWQFLPFNDSLRN